MPQIRNNLSLACINKFTESQCLHDCTLTLIHVGNNYKLYQLGVVLTVNGRLYSLLMAGLSVKTQEPYLRNASHRNYSSLSTDIGYERKYDTLVQIKFFASLN